MPHSSLDLSLNLRFHYLLSTKYVALCMYVLVLCIPILLQHILYIPCTYITLCTINTLLCVASSLENDLDCGFFSSQGHKWAYGNTFSVFVNQFPAVFSLACINYWSLSFLTKIYELRRFVKVVDTRYSRMLKSNSCFRLVKIINNLCLSLSNY